MSWKRVACWGDWAAGELGIGWFLAGREGCLLFSGGRVPYLLLDKCAFSDLVVRQMLSR